MPQPRKTVTRNALAPGLLAAVVLIAGLALIGGDWFTAVRYVVTVLALIVCVFAVQAGQAWWLAGLVPIAVVWNPVLPIPVPEVPWKLLQLGAALVFVIAGIRITTSADERR